MTIPKEHARAIRDALDAVPTEHREWPKPMDDAAFHGPAGEFVKGIEEGTEADRHGLLLQLLAGAGNIIGRGPGLMADGAFHPPNIWPVLIGATSRARKGTSWAQVRRPLAEIDSDWAEERIDGGLSSGEGVAYRVRDERIGMRKAKKGEFGDARGMVEEVLDPGVSDKRLLIVETEFAQPFKVMQREGNTLAIALRCAWEGTSIGGLTKRDPTRAKRHHITLIGHITVDEARRVISELDVANGLVNRMLICCVRRARLLPNGGSIARERLDALILPLFRAVSEARKLDGALDWTPEANAMWCSGYERLSAERPGQYGAATARAEAQVLRLALTYCLLDERALVDVEHLRAALAVWHYCDRSAAYLFGEATGDPLADRFLDALHKAPGGLTRTQLRDLAGSDRPAERIETALELLARYRLARRVDEPETGGRPAERWFAIRQEEEP